MNSEDSECVRPTSALINTSCCAWNALVVVLLVFLAVDVVLVVFVVVAVRTMGWIWSAA